MLNGVGYRQPSSEKEPHDLGAIIPQSLERFLSFLAYRIPQQHGQYWVERPLSYCPKKGT